MKGGRGEKREGRRVGSNPLKILGTWLAVIDNIMRHLGRLTCTCRYVLRLWCILSFTWLRNLELWLFGSKFQQMNFSKQLLSFH